MLTPVCGHGLDRLAGLAEALTGYGTVTNEVRAAHQVPRPPAPFASRLGLPAGAGAVYIERLRRLDGAPLSLDATYLSLDIGCRLLGCDLAGRDLFALIEEVTGQRLGRADVTVHAVNAGPDTATSLGIAEGAAVFAIDRLTCLADGRPADSEAIYIRADRLTLHASVHRAPPG